MLELAPGIQVSQSDVSEHKVNPGLVEGPVLAVDVLGGSRPSDTSRLETLVSGSYRPMARHPRYDLSRHHGALLEPRSGSLCSARETDELDASCLIMPLMRIVSPVDTRWLSTMRALGKDLLDDSLVYRYRAPDGFTGKEGTFCMFFLVYRMPFSFRRHR
jgi:hypothetical protein